MSDCFLRIVPRGAPQARPKNGISGYVVRSEGRGPGVGWGGGCFGAAGDLTYRFQEFWGLEPYDLIMLWIALVS